MLPLLCVCVDPDLTDGTAVLPRRMAHLGDEVWIAPAAALFRGRRFRATYDGRVARLSTIKRLGSVFDLVVTALHPNFFDDSAQPSVPTPSLTPADLAHRLDKSAAIQRMRQRMADAQRDYNEGLVTEHELFGKAIEVIQMARGEVIFRLRSTLPAHLRNLSDDLLAELFGVPGLRMKPSGAFEPFPVVNNRIDGLTGHEFFVTARTARRSAIREDYKQRKLRELWAKLVTTLGAMTVTAEDCGADRYREIDPAYGSAGRHLATPVRSPWRLFLYPGGWLARSDLLRMVEDDIRRIAIRTPLGCRAQGVCRTCYGRDVVVGDPVGARAARRLTEAADRLPVEQRSWRLGPPPLPTSFPDDTIVRYRNLDVAPTPDPERDGRVRVEGSPEEPTWTVLANGGALIIETIDGVRVREQPLAAGERLRIQDGQICPARTEPVSFRLWGRGVVARCAGVVRVEAAVSPDIDHFTGLTVPRTDGAGRVTVGGQVHPLAAKAWMHVQTGQFVRRGALLAVEPPKDSNDEALNLARLFRLLHHPPPAHPAPMARVRGRVSAIDDEEVIIEGVVHAASGHHAVQVGDWVEPGDRLTLSGEVDGRALFSLLGPRAFGDFLADELEPLWPGLSSDVELLVAALIQDERLVEVGAPPG